MRNGAYAWIVEDSIAPSGIRLTTMVVCYANIIKQDLWTHRSVSKNTDVLLGQFNDEVSRSSNSNRAIPTKKIIMEVWRNPFCPARFPKRSAAMHSAQGYHTGLTAWVMRHAWLKMRYIAILCTLLLLWLGCHKQIANRLLDQWQYTTAVFTATEEWWRHFFSLRNHYAAQDQVQDVASEAYYEYDTSDPKQLKAGEWHLPFVMSGERTAFDIYTQLKLSVARCARTSYTVAVATSPAYPHAADIDLHDRLAPQVPEHAGPREHQARALTDPKYRSGNFNGWDQLRHSNTGKQMVQAIRDSNALNKLKAIQIGVETTPGTRLDV